MERPHRFYHDNVGPGSWVCPKTGKTVTMTFHDSDRPGSPGLANNACRECHQDQRSIPQRLHDVAEQRKRRE